MPPGSYLYAAMSTDRWRIGSPSSPAAKALYSLARGFSLPGSCRVTTWRNSSNPISPVPSSSTVAIKAATCRVVQYSSVSCGSCVRECSHDNMRTSDGRVARPSDISGSSNSLWSISPEPEDTASTAIIKLSVLAIAQQLRPTHNVPSVSRKSNLWSSVVKVVAKVSGGQPVTDSKQTTIAHHAFMSRLRASSLISAAYCDWPQRACHHQVIQSLKHSSSYTTFSG